MAARSARIGLMGGTFNPVHLGHLVIAQEALVAYDLDEVLFIPNKLPPHRAHERSLASEEHRYAMTSLAVNANPRFFASRLELDRDQVSYTVDTVTQLREEQPERSLYFVTGADALMKYVWKDLDRLLSHLAAFLVATRPGFAFEDVMQRLAPLSLANQDRIKPLKVPAIEISSTMIRERLCAGTPIRYLVPREVEDYIAKYALYGAKQPGGELV